MKKRHNKFGYKVGYREKDSRLFVCEFKTYTYEQAIVAQRYYLNARQQKFEIRPIRFAEILKGIWRENPF